MKAEKGDWVKVEYEGKLEDGTVFDSSKQHGEPLHFEVGSKMMIKGFDEAVEGMEKGQEKEFTLEPADAYGERIDEMVRDFPKEKMPEGDIKPGVMLTLVHPSGQQILAKVVEVKDDAVKLDLNHPLAGKKLKFWIKVVDVEKKK
ncbi:peptidylprolyl isomerase [Candidatus Woesearchaeota archaeon]|nr:peptidylprolyl isomerase [Candidatus Woesearchaeota archaeon]